MSDFISISEFLNECNKFHSMKSEEEKHRKCLKLISYIDNLTKPDEIDELLYYSNIGELYYYASKIKSKKYQLSNGITFDMDAILEENNKNNVEEILKYKLLAFENYKKSLDNEIIKKCITKIKERSLLDDTEKIVGDMCDRNREQFRIISQDLCSLYYIIGDEDNFLLYSSYATQYGSLNAISFLLKYYCDKLDYDNAYKYYELMNNFNRVNYNNPHQNVIIKLGSYPIYYKFLYNAGMYEESLNVSRTFKEYVSSLNLEQREIVKPIVEHIRKCKKKLEEIKNNECREEVLLQNFKPEILNIMSDDIKIYISTSLNVYQYMKLTKITMDYSATLMPILKAIESILFEIIGVKYHKFIIEKKEIEKNHIKGFLNKQGDFIRKIDKLEYGTALSLIGRKNNYKSLENTEIIPNKYFIEFCNKNNIKESKAVIIKMYEEIDKLREKRNLVAHKNRVYEECVKECYEILLENIKFINYLYTKFKFVFENNININ